MVYAVDKLMSGRPCLVRADSCAKLGKHRYWDLAQRARSFHSAYARLHFCLQTANPFKHSREMDGVQKTLANLPGMVFYGAALLLISAAGALGYSAGARAPGSVLHSTRQCFPHVLIDH